MLVNYPCLWLGRVALSMLPIQKQSNWIFPYSSTEKKVVALGPLVNLFYDVTHTLIVMRTFRVCDARQSFEFFFSRKAHFHPSFIPSMFTIWNWLGCVEVCRCRWLVRNRSEVLSVMGKVATTFKFQNKWRDFVFIVFTKFLFFSFKFLIKIIIDESLMTFSIWAWW